MIYVDNYRGRLGRIRMSHLLSDESVEELHEFAKRLGLKRRWFQDGSAPHYDVCQSMRRRAIELGAKPIKCGSQEWRRVYHGAKGLSGSRRE